MKAFALHITAVARPSQDSLSSMRVYPMRAVLAVLGLALASALIHAI